MIIWHGICRYVTDIGYDRKTDLNLVRTDETSDYAIVDDIGTMQKQSVYRRVRVSFLYCQEVSIMRRLRIMWSG